MEDVCVGEGVEAEVEAEVEAVWGGCEGCRVMVCKKVRG